MQTSFRFLSILLVNVGLVVGFSGCTKTETIVDDRLLGSWSYYYHWEDANGINEETESIYYFFNDDYVDYSRNYEKYTTAGGWLNNDADFEYYWKVEGDQLYLKLYENEFGTWNSKTIEFVSSNEIRIDGKLFEKF